ncbi:MAG: polysaccharide biosynthesis protein [Flavobacteriales bacterium]|nr:polysaccharide biosynthesis protein [Flavobacteriales bacterium]
MMISLPFAIAVRILSFIVFRTYAGIIQFTSTEDGVRIFYTVSVGTLLLTVVNIIQFYFTQQFLIPFSVVVIDYFFMMFFMGGLRVFIRILYYELRKVNREQTKVIIYGAGEPGSIAKKTLERDLGVQYKVIAFVDSNPKLARKKMEGISIYDAAESLEGLFQNKEVDQLIFADSELALSKKQDLIDLCLKYNIKLLDVPPASKWINGELSFNQFKEIRIEDLLERPSIQLDKKKIRNQLVGKTVMITGAAGSIGSEMVRQIIPFKPLRIVLIDNAETPLFELELELREGFRFQDYEIVIGDIRNRDRLENAFKTFKPDFVYHAAAYKHVPMMELNPSEAIHNNVMGTKNLSDLSVQYGVNEFVMVSTDKAVNPTNVMGASKRIAEMYVQSLYNSIKDNPETPTKFVTTRFGNVLGSNGSVIPLFRKQIQAGGPLTVTHADVTRYFMTIPEACQLVLEAGSMGNGGEIFIFDMGKSVKIVDLAKKMIKLSGLELGKDIQIAFTGLRPGEKLYEELLNDEENTLPTHHKKIMIANVREYDFEVVSAHISELIGMFDEQDNFKIVAKMKQMVPEFLSRNSIYEELDESSEIDDTPKE